MFKVAADFPPKKLFIMSDGSEKEEEVRPFLNEDLESKSSISGDSVDHDDFNQCNDDLWEQRTNFFDTFWGSSSAQGRGSDYFEPSKRKRCLSEFFSIEWTTVSTVRFLKAYLAVVVALILALIMPVNRWLGRYPFLLPFACLFHHPGRTSGSQLFITALSVSGGAIGIGWGTLGTYIATCTAGARHGTGVFHAVSLMFGIFAAGWLKAGFLRLHFFCTTFFICLFFMEVVDVNNLPIDSSYWIKIVDIVQPYLIGMALSLAINVAVLPDFGQLDLVESYNGSLEVLKSSIEQLALCQEVVQSMKLKQKINAAMSRLSDESRERLNEISFINMNREDMLTFRNHLSACLIRARTIPIPGELYCQLSNSSDAESGNHSLVYIQKHFSGQAADIVISCCSIVGLLQKIVQDRFTLRNFFCGKSENHRQNSALLQKTLQDLREQLSRLSENFRDLPERHLEEMKENPATHTALLHIYYLYGCAQDVLSFGEFALSYKHKWQIVLPSYPIYFAFKRTTRQIRHDTGGEAVMLFHWATREVNEVIADIKATDMAGQEQPKYKRTLGHRIWKILHRLQGIETQFAFRLTLTVTLLCLPAWLHDSMGWYNEYSSWLAPLMTFLLSHPFTAGVSTHLATRTLFCILGGVWAGVSYRARYGNPYVIAVMGGVFLLPTLYRYTSSRHPRSGFCSCASFLLIAIILYTDLMIKDFQLEPGQSPPENIFDVTWTTTVAAEIGVVTSFLSSWVFWPFIAHREIYNCISDVLDNIAHYAHYMFQTHACRERDEVTGNDEIPPSVQEMCAVFETRLLRKLHTVRGIVKMAENEPLFRSRFHALGYNSILERCEIFLLDLIVCRISSTHFSVNPRNEKQKLFIKDSVAGQLFLLYFLSGSFRQHSLIPRRVPSILQSETFLFEHVDVLKESPDIWAVIHRMAFRSSFLRSAEDMDKLVNRSREVLSGRAVVEQSKTN